MFTLICHSDVHIELLHTVHFSRIASCKQDLCLIHSQGNLESAGVCQPNYEKRNEKLVRSQC